MTTAMEMAFARSKGVTLAPTAPDSRMRDKSHDITVVIANTRFTLRQLMDGVPLPLGDIDRHILDQAEKHLSLRHRIYTIDNNGRIFFQKPHRPGSGQKPPKLIGYTGYEAESDKVVTDIDRELVVVLKGEKDLFTTESGTIKHMRNLLLRLLADTDSRAYLRDNRDAAFEYIGRINYALDQKRADPSLESASRKHYEETTQALGFTELDHMVVHALSWEWKDRPIYRSHPYACRCWIIIPCLFGLIKRPNSDHK